MKREKMTGGGHMERDEELCPELRFLGGLAGKIQDQLPPEELLARVMAGIQPKKPSVGRRFWRFLTGPQVIRVTPIRLIPGAAVLMAVLIGWLWLGAPWPARWADQSSIQASAGPDEHRFTVFLPKSSSVALIGDFNNWNPRGYEMNWDEGCRCYSLSLPLPRGRYQYTFLVDGRILTDPQAVLSQDDGFGHKNSIVIINHDRPDEKTI